MNNVAVEKTGNENSLGTLRRFTKRVQESGVLRRVRGIRYKDRNKSKYVTKKKTLKKLRKREEIQDQIKRGIAVEITRR
jgi:ribosomal protein S21